SCGGHALFCVAHEAGGRDLRRARRANAPPALGRSGGHCEPMRDKLKACARALATVVVYPRIVAFRFWSAVLGADRALESATQALARIPGVRGQYLRSAFLRRAIARCDRTATVCFGTVLSKAGAAIEEHVYVGPGCQLGLVHLERDVLLGAGVHIPSGAHVHGTDDPDIAIRLQPGRRTRVRVGAGTWVGSAAVILADVGRHCVIGAGSVVTQPIPDHAMAAGVPARVIRSRAPLANAKASST